MRPTAPVVATPLGAPHRSVLHPLTRYDPDQEADPTWDYPRVRLGGWKYERVREDKKLPNDIKTVESIKVSGK